MVKNKCVFLDRDGVLNQAIIKNKKPYSPRDLHSFKLLPNSVQSIKRLTDMGFLTIVITNQPDIATGHLSLDLLNKFNNILYSKMKLTDILYCPHIETDNCFCRKPNTGMIDHAKIKYNIDLKKSFVIGDRWRDVDCGIKSGCKTIFIDYDYHENLNNTPHAIVSNLSSGVNLIEEWSLND